MNNQHKKNKLILRIVSILVLVAGLTLSIIGFSHFGDFESDLFMLTMLGLPCVALGIFLLLVSFGQSISRFVKNEHTPIINEYSKDVSPAIRNYAMAVKEGLGDNDGVICSCGNHNDKNNKFCSACGKALQIVCPACGKNVETEDKFCPNCGEKLN